MANSSRITHCFINTPSSSLFTYTLLQIFKNASCSNFRFFITLEQLLPSDQFFVNCFYTLSKMPQVKEIIVICDPFYQDIFEDAKEHIQVDLKFALPEKERQDSVYSRLQVVGYYQGPPVMPLLQYYTAPPPRRNYGYLEGCLDALFVVGSSMSVAATLPSSSSADLKEASIYRRWRPLTLSYC